MELLRRIKRGINRPLNKLGYELQNLDQSSTFQSALKRLSARGIDVASVIDVGASDGRWTRELLPYLPEAEYLLIDANPIHAPALRRFCAGRPKLRHRIVAASDRAGEVYFDASHAFIGVAGHERRDEGDVRLPADRLDAIVEAEGLPAPYLLKLDTHGFEAAILAGAEAVLRQSRLLIIEAYNFPVQPGAMRFYELCQHLAERGFRPVDLCDPIHRFRDGALWQLDLFFEPVGQRVEIEDVADAYALFGMQRERGQLDPTMRRLPEAEMSRARPVASARSAGGGCRCHRR